MRKKEERKKERNKISLPSTNLHSKKYIHDKHILSESSLC